MKKIMNWFKIIVPVGLFVVLVTPTFAAINIPVLEGTCGGKNTQLSGNSLGDILLDGNKITEANGVWSLKSDIKSGNHTIAVGGESLEFSIPKCPENGGVIGQSPCLGLFNKFWDACQAELKAKSGPTLAEQALITELKNQILVLQLQIQLLQLKNQLKTLLGR